MIQEGEIIAEFEKNSREKVRVSLTEFHGLDLLDVRSYYQGTDGDWKPGKGLAVRRALITPLRKALQAAEKAAKDAGKETANDADD
jgi:hypothetical protein